MILFVIIFAISCNRNDNLVNPKENPPQERIVKATEAGNEQNSFDHAGEMHNEFISMVAKSGGDVSEAQLKKITSKILADGDREEAAKVLDNFHEIYVSASSNMPAIGGPAQQFICEEYPWICQFINPSPTFPFMAYDADSDKSATDQTLNFIEEIKKNEKDIESANHLEPGQKEEILAAYSIARYSAMYWHNNTVDGNTTFPEAALLKNPVPVIVADVKGFIDGYTWGGFIPGVIWGSIKSALAATKLQTSDNTNGDTGKMIDDEMTANKKNILDTVGKMHNAFIAFYSKRYNTVSRESLREAFVEFFKNDKRDETKMVLSRFDEIYDGVQENLALIGTPPFNPSSWRPCRYLPDWVCDILYPSDPLPLMILSDGDGNQYQRNLTFLRQIKGLENRVIKEEMEEEQKLTLLGAYSVARFSSTYWYNAMILGGSTGEVQAMSIDKGTVLADIGGAGVGAKVGSYGGFWGCVAGVVIGGAVGSIAYHYAS